MKYNTKVLATAIKNTENVENLETMAKMLLEDVNAAGAKIEQLEAELAKLEAQRKAAMDAIDAATEKVYNVKF